MEPIKAPAAESPAKRMRQTEGVLDSAEGIIDALLLLLEGLGLGSSTSESELLLVFGEFAVAISVSLSPSLISIQKRQKKKQKRKRKQKVIVLVKIFLYHFVRPSFVFFPQKRHRFIEEIINTYQWSGIVYQNFNRESKK